MKLYQMKWWKKVFKKEVRGKDTSSLENLKAIMEFLEDAHHEINTLKPHFEHLKELEKEREIANDSLIKVNLQAQAETIDKILGLYEFFQNDTDINGIRVKRIAASFLSHAKKADLHELVRLKLKDKKWAGW
jgi:hypothetical protein